MDPTSKSDVVNIVNNFNHNENPTSNDIALIKTLFSTNQEYYLADVFKDQRLLQELEVKLLNKGVRSEDPVFEKIHAIATILQETEFDIIPREVDPLLQTLSQNIEFLKKINLLREGDHLALYRQRRTGDESLSVEKQAPSRLISFSTSFIYEKTEDAKDVLKFFASKREKIMASADQLIDVLNEESTRPEDMQKGIDSLVLLIGELIQSKGMLNNLKNNPLYKNPQGLLFLESEKAKISEYEEILSSVIPRLQEGFSMKNMMKSQSKIEHVKFRTEYNALNQSRMQLESQSLNASNIFRQNQLIADFTDDLISISRVTHDRSSISFEKKPDLEFMPFKINGKTVPYGQEKSHIIRIVGLEAAPVLLNLVSTLGLKSLETDLHASRFERHAFAEVTLNSFNQLEVTWKMALKGAEEISFVKRTIQIPLHQLQLKISENKFKGIEDFRVVDLISPPVSNKIFEDLGGYANYTLDILDKFNQKPWGIATGKILSKTASPIGIDEKQPFLDILKGKAVDMNPFELQGKDGKTYIVPHAFGADLVRFTILKLNGNLIYSTNREELKDTARAFEMIAEAFKEDPETSQAARIAPIALTQTGIADMSGKLDMDTFFELDMAVGGPLGERIQEMYIDDQGNLILQVKAIKYQMIPDIHQINPTDAVILSRKLTMPLQELKDAIEKKDVNLLVSLKGVDKVSESLYIRDKNFVKKKGADNDKPPRLINSDEHAFIIPERDAYELLDNFQIFDESNLQNRPA
jgi:hypothetical protein